MKETHQANPLRLILVAVSFVKVRKSTECLVYTLPFYLFYVYQSTILPIKNKKFWLQLNHLELILCVIDKMQYKETELAARGKGAKVKTDHFQGQNDYYFLFRGWVPGDSHM